MPCFCEPLKFIKFNTITMFLQDCLSKGSKRTFYVAELLYAFSYEQSKFTNSKFTLWYCFITKSVLGFPHQMHCLSVSLTRLSTYFLLSNQTHIFCIICLAILPVWWLTYDLKFLICYMWRKETAHQKSQFTCKIKPWHFEKNNTESNNSAKAVFIFFSRIF